MKRLAFLVILLLVGSAAPRPAAHPRTYAGSTAPTETAEQRTGAPQDVMVQLEPRTGGAPQPTVPSVALASRPVGSRSSAIGETPTTGNGGQSTSAQDASAVTWEGTLSWVLPSYGAHYLALPQPRGTRVRICGPAACLTRVSTDVGPDQRVVPDRVADLSAADWQRVSGMPLSVGLTVGTVTIVNEGD